MTIYHLDECHEWKGGECHTWEPGAVERARSHGFDPCKCGKRVRRLEVREVVVSRGRDEVRGLRPWTGPQ